MAEEQNNTPANPTETIERETVNRERITERETITNERITRPVSTDMQTQQPRNLVHPDVAEVRYNQMAVETEIDKVEERGTLDFSGFFRSIQAKIQELTQSGNSRQSPSSPTTETSPDQNAGNSPNPNEPSVPNPPPSWMEGQPRRRDDITINNTSGELIQQLDRIIASQVPNHEINERSTDTTGQRAAELGIITGRAIDGNQIDLARLKELSTERWTGLEGYTHINDLPIEDRKYIQDMLMHTGYLDANAHGPADGQFAGADSLSRRAAVQAGIISNDGAIRVEALKELDEYYLETEFMKYAPVILSRNPNQQSQQSSVENQQPVAVNPQVREQANEAVANSQTPVTVSQADTNEVQPVANALPNTRQNTQQQMVG